jgi:hypothetical protein
VTNWPEYDAALVRRGSLTVWFTEEAVAAWHAPASKERGGQPIYSAIAIETGLALPLVFHQPLRQTEGLLRSIADALGVDIAIPDYTSLKVWCWRSVAHPRRHEGCMMDRDHSERATAIGTAQMDASQSPNPPPAMKATCLRPPGTLCDFADAAAEKAIV